MAIVEDDVDLLDSYLEYLRDEGYSAWGVSSAEAFYKKLFVAPVDVVILDVGLPGDDGISIAQHLSQTDGIVVIIVSARDATDDRVAGLRAGADRYLLKPIDMALLTANIEAVSRQQHLVAKPSLPTSSQRNLACDDAWQLSSLQRTLSNPLGNSFQLTAREFIFMNLLYETQGEPLSKRVIGDKIFGARTLNTAERLDVLVARLRKKGQTVLGQSLPVMTVHNFGYAFTASLKRA
ncbi:response regulator transcription factor [Azonexus fungiphilus]|uniref:response regulator transcription factor n=1 Tax=Azonexus fungiphilus TaxID=146940 RepID=UPI00147626BE|nr:response regulator transcription factor [Azonexus fungiphilus]